MKHSERTLFPCDKCSFASNSKAQLRKHMSVHGIVQKDKHCTECSECFLTKS